VRGIKEIGNWLIGPRTGRGVGQSPSLSDAGASYLTLPAEDRRVIARGDSTYRELCFTCHGNDGRGAPMQGAPAGTLLAPPLAGSSRVLGHRDYIIKVLLHGLSGELDGKTYQGGAVMVPMGANTDEWIADVASFVRNSFGNQASFVTPEQVAAVRTATARRRTPWTIADITPTLPVLLANATEWKFSASHNNDAAANATGAAGARWDTGVAQAPGMWFQIELPAATTLSEVQIDSAVPAAGRGRGAAPAAGRGAPGAPGAPGVAPAAGAPAPGAAAPPAAGRAGAPAAPGAAAPAGAPQAGAAAGRGAGGGGRGGPPANGPVAFSLQLSTNGTSWTMPVAQGTGATPTTIMAFRPARAKFVRITQTGQARTNELWAIQQVRIYQAPGQ
jgi:mono/diheme cytochrome c family protein